jgi:hypothetical protein
MEVALTKDKKAAEIAASIASRLGRYGRFDFKDVWERVVVPKRADKTDE